MKLSGREKIAAEVVRRVQAQLPAPVRAAAAAVPVHCATRPGAEADGEPEPQELLGLFVGASRADPDASDPVPAQIYLYLENLWDLAEGRIGDFRDEVRVTYLHELGHFFGWDEDAVAGRGLD